MMSNTSNSTVSEEDLVQEYNNVFRKTVLPVTTFFGVELVSGFFGNLLTMFVFLLYYKPCNFRFFVLSLAWTDFISCLTTIPAEMVSQMYWFAYPVPAICKIKVFFNQYTVCSEAATLTMIAIDRHRKLCRPFGWQIKQKAALYSCIVIHIISALLAIPTPIFWGVYTKVIAFKGQNITVTLCEKDAKYQDTSFPLVNTSVNGSIVSVSLLLMFVLYILVAKRLLCGRTSITNKTETEAGELSGNTTDVSSVGLSNDVASRKSSSHCDTRVTSRGGNVRVAREKSNTSSLSNSEHALSKRAQRKTLIAFILTVIFIVTTILFWTLISIVATGILSRLDGTGKTIYFFFLRLYFINHVINPILYGILDPQFRRVMGNLKTRIYCCCSRRI